MNYKNYEWLSLVINCVASGGARVVRAHPAQGNSTPSHKGIYVTIIVVVRESIKIILVWVVRVVEH